MKFIETQLTIEVQTLRDKLYKEFTGPLDSMWQDLFIANSSLFLIAKENRTIGFCCIDDNKTLLQIYLENPFKYLMYNTISELIDVEKIQSAKLSSIEPVSFNVCVELAKSLKKDTINYTHSESIPQSNIQLRNCSKEDIPRIKAFYKAEIGFDDQIGYTENIIHRKELYCLEDGDNIIGTGECRLSETQPKYADLGIAVSQSHRTKGIGTSIMSKLVNIALKKDRTPICSTTFDNVGSQKAIERAGFYPSHIIFDMTF